MIDYEASQAHCCMMVSDQPHSICYAAGKVFEGTHPLQSLIDATAVCNTRVSTVIVSRADTFYNSEKRIEQITLWNTIDRSFAILSVFYTAPYSIFTAMDGVGHSGGPFSITPTRAWGEYDRRAIICLRRHAEQVYEVSLFPLEILEMLLVHLRALWYQDSACGYVFLTNPDASIIVSAAPVINGSQSPLLVDPLHEDEAFFELINSSDDDVVIINAEP